MEIITLKDEYAKKRHIKKRLVRDWRLYVLLLPALLYIIVFCYVPMYGVLMSFQNYKPSLGIAGSQWVGFDQFKRFFASPMFGTVIKNTITLSLYSLLAGFPLPIIFALGLNRVNNARYKKIVQTVTYAPHFISSVVMASMIILFLSPRNGIINHVITFFGGEPIFFMANNEMFKHIYVISGIWQTVGWSSIIYIAALSSVDPTLYESASIDGATKLRMIWHIDIPTILPTIVILLVMNAGKIMSVGYEKVYLLQNSLNTDASEIISTYVYKTGLVGGQYSFSAAVGLFNSIVNVILLVIVNKVAKTLGETSLW